MRHKIKDDKWHVLNRTGMYLGSTTEADHQEYIIVDGKMQQLTVKYIPAVIKMINEIIDNSVDALKDSKKGKIDVIFGDEEIEVKDNGSGIPVNYIQDLDGTDIITPKAMWGKAKAGSNFNDDEKDADTIGTNGVGSFCTNVLSKYFIGTTCDGKKIYTGTWSNNADNYSETIKESTKRGTSVKFAPDFSRFDCDIPNMKGSYIVIKQRLINLSMLFPNISFTLNEEDIKYSRKDFLDSFGKAEVYEEDNYIIGVLPNDTDDFSCFSIINGLNLKSGSHIEYVTKYLIQGIKEKLPKKFNTIKPGDIKNKLNVVFIGAKFPKLVWEGQTKESIKNSDKDIRQYLGDDWKTLIQKVAKNKDITDPIIYLHQVKLEAEQRKLLKDVDKQNKKADILKLLPASKENKYFFILEGDSAKKGLVSSLGREDKAYLPLRGVVINVFTKKLAHIAKNPEFLDIMNSLGFSFSSVNTCLDMNFEQIIIATDADVDGAHIRGLLLGFFYKFAPDVFLHRKIKILRTPIKVAKDQKENIVAAFLNENEYQVFMKNPKNSKYTIEYKKGLGSMNNKEYAQFFKIRPFNECLAEINYDESDFELLEKWLMDDSDFRKDKIQARLKLYDTDKI
ncbi:MAG: toprim domain-containing protein [Sphaerochaeta sp.]